MHTRSDFVDLFVERGYGVFEHAPVCRQDGPAEVLLCPSSLILASGVIGGFGGAERRCASSCWASTNFESNPRAMKQL
jgi:hypothetical protein